MITPANDWVSKILTKKSKRYLQLTKFPTFSKNTVAVKLTKKKLSNSTQIVFKSAVNNIYNNLK